MKTLGMTAGLALLVGICVMPPVQAQQTASERSDLARYQQYAEAPVDHVRYFTIQGFQYLAPNTVAVWFGVNKLYLLTVQTPCTDLPFANGIGLTARNNMLYANFDFVTVRGQRCKILKIVQVDELKMKQDAGKAGPSSSGGQLPR